MKYQPQLAKDSKEFVHGPEWLVERKWDGMRAIFELEWDDENEVGNTRIFSRTGQDLRPQFPELLDLHERIQVPCVLDGEIVTMVGEDTEDLESLQFRISQKNPSKILLSSTPVEVRFFDVLESLGHSVTAYPFARRRELLAEILSFTYFSLPETVTSLESIPEHWEGVVSKRKDSIYHCGKRRSTWLKYKLVQRATLRATELTKGLGARSSTFGAVRVADASGTHRGQVGSGFKQEDLDRLMQANATGFDHDQVLIEVEYRFLSKTGLMVNTAFKGIRYDKVEPDIL